MPDDYTSPKPDTIHKDTPIYGPWSMGSGGPGSLGGHSAEPIDDIYGKQKSFLKGQDGGYLGYGKIGDARFQKRYSGSEGQMWGGVGQQKANMAALAARRGMTPGAARAAQYSGGEVESRGWGMANQLKAMEQQQRDRLMYDASQRRAMADMEQQKGELQYLSDYNKIRNQWEGIAAEELAPSDPSEMASWLAAGGTLAVALGASDKRAKKKAFEAGRRDQDALIRSQAAKYGEYSPVTAPRSMRRPTSIPIVDPMSGRVMSHAERDRQQSLPPAHRGPGWQQTHGPGFRPGDASGPAMSQPGDAAYWAGAPMAPPPPPPPPPPPRKPMPSSVALPSGAQVKIPEGDTSMFQVPFATTPEPWRSRAIAAQAAGDSAAAAQWAQAGRDVQESQYAVGAPRQLHTSPQGRRWVGDRNPYSGSLPPWRHPSGLVAPPRWTPPVSDERAKKSAYRAGRQSVDELVGQLEALPPPGWADAAAPDTSDVLRDNDQTIRNLTGHTYEYKDYAKDRFGSPDGRQYGVMAQDLQQTPLGRTMLAKAPTGELMIDRRAATGATLGMIGRLGQRIDNLERRES